MIEDDGAEGQLQKIGTLAVAVRNAVEWDRGLKMGFLELGS